MAKDPIFERYIKRTRIPEFKKVPISTCKSCVCVQDFWRTKTNFNCYTFFIVIGNFTSDCWEDFNNNHYFCFTAHFIDHEWILQKRIIGLRKFNFSHVASNLRSLIMMVINIFGIDNFFSVSSDNVRENTTTIQYLQSYFRLISIENYFLFVVSSYY